MKKLNAPKKLNLKAKAKASPLAVTAKYFNKV